MGGAWRPDHPPRNATQGAHGGWGLAERGPPGSLDTARPRAGCLPFARVGRQAPKTAQKCFDRSGQSQRMRATLFYGLILSMPARAV
jgi:hypothetical protein